MNSKADRLGRCRLIVPATTALTLLAACRSPMEPTVTLAPSAVAPSPGPTAPVPPSTQVPLRSCDEGALFHVTRESVGWLEWSKSGAQLFYRLANRDEYRVFDPTTCTATAIARQEIPLPPFDGTGWTSFHLPEGVGEHQQHVSPSGAWVIFVQERHLLPTPTPGADGESWGPMAIESDVYLLARGAEEPVYLGTMAAVARNFVWTSDERAVFLVAEQRMPHSGHLWAADLERQELRLLFPARQGEPGFSFEALSPDGQHLLYGDGDALYLYDLGTDSRELLSIPVFGVDWYWFLSENTLLIIDDFDPALDFVVATYSLESGELRYVYEEPLQVHSAALSADSRYLAILDPGAMNLSVLPVSRALD